MLQSPQPQSSSDSFAGHATTQFYSWRGYRCAYDVLLPSSQPCQNPPLLLIHPIGVGLSRQFWLRFYQEWQSTSQRHVIYNPDLLGCGESDMPQVAYTPEDWAEQLQYFLQTVVKTPVIVVVQGALLPVAIDLVRLQSDHVVGLVLCGPPAWALIAKETPNWQHRLSWNLFDSPLGNAFYRYARRSQFLRSFSVRQLFATDAAVDSEWLTLLKQGAQNLASRYAVFSFLAGFWRQNYQPTIAAIAQPTLVVMGEQASSISREGKRETPDQRLADYLQHFPQAKGVKIPGRNVLAYESTTEFVRAMTPFVEKLRS